MAKNSLVDFHCHLDLYPDFPTIMTECERGRVHTLSVTTTPKAWPRNRGLAAKLHYVRAALGLHPQLISQRANEIQLLETYLSETRYVGEVGLDAGRSFYSSFELQKEVFSKILKLCSRAGGKILSVHSVRAASTVLDIIEKYLSTSDCRVVLHWFTGSKAEAQRAIEMGCYFSINSEMLKKEHHRKLVTAIPFDRLLTETDGPFCRFEGHPIHPTNISGVVDLLADVIGKDPGFIQRAILLNLDRLETQ